MNTLKEGMPIDSFFDFSCLNVTVVTNTGGPGWWHWPLYWFILGVGFWIAGMINYKRK